MVFLISVAATSWRARTPSTPRRTLTTTSRTASEARAARSCSGSSSFCRWLGCTAFIYSVRTIQHPKGEEYTGPIPVTMQRVINLAMPYFLGFLQIWTVVSVEELTC